MMDDRMFFVVGAPRSGTTLLMRMLNAHDDVLSRPEPHLMTPLAHLGYYDYVDKAPYDPFQSAQSTRAFVADLPRGEEDYLDAVRAYCDTLYGRMLEPSGKRYFLDKTPAYSLILPFVGKVYPGAVYVVLTRHPFAIFSSFAKSFFDNDWAAAHEFNPVVERYVPAIAAFLRDRPVERLHHVRYEELVTRPSEHMRAICDVAGLPFDESMVQYGDTKMDVQGLGDPIGVEQHKRPTTASVDKWVHEVHGNDTRLALLQGMVERLSDEDLAIWGYTRESLWAPLSEADPEKAREVQDEARKWDRYHVERRLLLHLRRNIHDNALGRVLRKVRFYTDVLLRE